ncbi:MAG TPA: protein kinase, partial [Anaerolineales bacterium]|nr:protein kinase [Anaerolineales bacterium]
GSMITLRDCIEYLHLTPELIRIDKKGEIKICGLGNAQPIGVAKVRKLQKTLPLYTSPEQVQSQPLTTAADIYALAVILYELVTGTWLNGKPAPKTVEAIRNNHLNITPHSPNSINKDLPDHFSRMLLWALRKNPDDRFQNATELISSLAMALRISVDEIPLRVNPEVAPVTSALLSNWTFLPVPQPSLLVNDAIPLEDRLAALTPPKKRKPRLGLVPFLLLVMAGGLISLFIFIKPAETPEIPTPIRFTPFAANFTPPPSPTVTPKPPDPHGGRIAFTCTRENYNQICMIHRDGTGLEQITETEAGNYYPVFSPDGNALLFASNRTGPFFDLFLLTFSKKQITQITDRVGNVISPDYSPDGAKIVFANRIESGPTAIWVVNADGLNPHRLFMGTKDIVAVAWSPNGEKIAYAMTSDVPQEYHIFVMDSDGKNHVQITQGLQGIGGSVDWARDGRSLLIHAGPFGDKDIFTVDVSNGSFTQLTDGGNNAGASYSPDGKFIVFNSMRNDDQADLYIMDADGSDQTQLTSDPEPDWGAKWID